MHDGEVHQQLLQVQEGWIDLHRSLYLPDYSLNYKPSVQLVLLTHEITDLLLQLKDQFLCEI